MKKIFKRFSLSFAALICAVCTGAGIAVSLDCRNGSFIAKGEAVSIADGDFYISGAGVRLVNDANGAGIRFHTKLANAEYEKLTGAYATGTLIVPEIRYDGELTLEDLEKESKYRPVNIDTTNIWFKAEEDGFMQSTAYLYNISEKAYGARYVARSYITYEDGTTVYSYTDKNRWKSMSDIATEKTLEDGVSDTLKAQVSPYIVDDVAVTYNLPMGKVSETAEYGSILNLPEMEYDDSVYQIDGWTDQYGREWDFATSEITMPITLTPTFSVKESTDTVTDSFFVAGGALEKVSSTETAPSGFTTVTQYKGTNAWAAIDAGVGAYDATDISGYNEVRFALKAVNGYVSARGTTSAGWDSSKTWTRKSDEWVNLVLTQTSPSVWTITFKHSGGTQTYENQTGSTLREVMRGDYNKSADGWAVYVYTDNYYKADTSTPNTCELYSTEIIGRKVGNDTAYPPLEGTKQLISSALVDSSLTDWSADCDEGAPFGFSSVSKYVASSAWTASYAMTAGYNERDISEFTDVWFALKFENSVWVRVFSATNTDIGKNGGWIYFHLTQTGTSVWTIEMRYHGAEIFTLENQNGTTIKEILYDVGSASAADGASVVIRSNGANAYANGAVLYSTEVRVLGEESPTPELPVESGVAPALKDTFTTGASAFRTNGASSGLQAYVDEFGVTAPYGFATVNAYTNSTNWASGALGLNAYGNDSLSAFNEIWFAIKLVGVAWQYGLNGVTTNASVVSAVENAEWWYFHLTKTGTTTWRVEVLDENGNAIVTMESADGDDVYTAIGGATNRPENGIATILYGDGNASADKNWMLLRGKTADVSAYIYATEVRAVRSEIEGERAIWSAVENAVPTNEKEVPDGFASVYKKENFEKGQLATLDLSNTGYTKLNFAIFADKNLTLRGITLAANRTYYVSMSKEENGWAVSVQYMSAEVAQFTLNGNTLAYVFASLNPADATTTVYCTEVRAIHVCSGGEATCTEPATCLYCGNEYAPAKGHGESVWVDYEYQCEDCGEVNGSVATEIEGQDVILFENATAATFNAQSANIVIDLSEISDLTIADGETQVTLGGDVYAGTLADGKLTFTVKPQDVFGEYTATVAVVIEGQEFTITAPVLVVTNQITTTAGLKAMKEILRGANLAAATSAGLGGIGGDDTMNGDGYYTLGADVVVNTGNEWAPYRGFAFGTPSVAFKGTFDGRGYALKNYRSNAAGLYGDLNAYQVNTANEVTNMYYESSLFGVVDGTIKNVAFINAKIGAYANLIFSGVGTVQDVYVQVTDVQNHSTGAKSPFFIYGQMEAGTLRNVVFDYTTYSTTYPTANFEAATGRAFKAENVAVYNFLEGYKDRVYYNQTMGAATNGAEVGIYATYTDGTNNGGAFTMSALNDELWTVANGMPTFKSLAADAETVAPSTQEEAVGELGYYIAWDSDADGAYDAAELIKSVTEASTGKMLTDGAAKPSAEARKQIIVGTYDEYYGYLANQPLLEENGCAYFGVYLKENTIFVLADNQDGLMYAAKELCRKLYGYQIYSPVGVQVDGKDGIEIPDDFEYTSYVAFKNRFEVNAMNESQKSAVGLSRGQEYTPFIEMHNALNYLDALSADKYGFTLSAYTDSNAKAADGPDDANDTAGEQLCYLARGNKTSFDNLVARVVDVIIQRAKADRRITNVNLMIEDNVDYCGCSACAKFSVPSIPQLIFLNEVAKKLQTNTEIISRTISVQCMAYAGFGKAPVLTSSDIANLNSLKTTLGIDYETATFSYDTSVAYTPSSTAELTVLKGEDNVRLLWTSHGANHSFGLTHEANDHMYESLQGWIAALGAKNIDGYMYQMTYQDYFLPLNTWKYQMEWYKTFSDLGLNTSISNLGDRHNAAGAQTAFGAFKTYINTRVMADVNVDYETLKAEFFAEDGYYGAGGPIMLQFFNELERVMESKKQTSDYLDYTTFRWDGGGNSATSKADRKQAFFNGEYHYDLASVMFSHWTSNGGTGARDLYDYNGKSQAQMLDQWYVYCRNALAKVDAKSVYAKRISIEQYFPEYAYLLTYTSYTTKATWSRLSNQWTNQTVVCTAPTTAQNIKITYQEFYDKVKTVMDMPSEFYSYNNNGTERNYMSTVYEGTYLYGMYKSAFNNWGVTF